MVSYNYYNFIKWGKNNVHSKILTSNNVYSYNVYKPFKFSRRI